MKIKMTENTYDLDAKEMKAVFEVSIKLGEVAEVGYGRRDIVETVKEQLAVHLSAKFLETNAIDEIFKQIDIEAVVKRIQLKVVESATR